MNDEEILALYWARDERATDAAAARYGAYCHAIAARILRSREDAEECVNDTYLRAWNAIPPEKPACLSAYLGRITRNLSLNRLRQAAAGKRVQAALALSELEECVPAGEDVETAAAGRELSRILDRFLRAQPQPGRDVFIRRYWYLDAVGDIARAYGMSESKAASLLFRMRKKLRAYLEKEGIDL